MGPAPAARLRAAVTAAVVATAVLGVPSVARGAAIAPTTAAPATASPTVAPATGGAGVPAPPNLNRFDLAQVGYEQSEVLLSGTARAFAPVTGTLTTDGEWKVAPTDTAPYTTRLVVYRPIKAKRFDGTVLVEWLNVSGGVDADPDWTQTHNELVRAGTVWVGVSAQAVGVNATKAADPARYASLSHPGDSFSYDIFSQAGDAIRHDAPQILGGLKPTTILGAGESQSASRLVTYIDAVHPLAHAYDGYFVHSRSGGGLPLSQAPQPVVLAPSPTLIRDDLDVPVLTFQTETDVSFGNAAYRQPDTKRRRLWEVAGSAHYDYYGLAIGPSDVGDGQGAVKNLAAMQAPASNATGFSCSAPINTGGTHWVLNAAVHALERWVVDGVAPPTEPLLQLASTSPVVLARDADGNALGGVRSPQVDAPIAALGGTVNRATAGSGFCFLFGTTVPFDAARLATLYPSHGAFVTAWNRASRQAVARGWLLPPDAAELRKAATASTVGENP